MTQNEALPPLAAPTGAAAPTRERFHAGHAIALHMVIELAREAKPLGDELADRNIRNAIARAREVQAWLEPLALPAGRAPAVPRQPTVNECQISSGAPARAGTTETEPSIAPGTLRILTVSDLLVRLDEAQRETASLRAEVSPLSARPPSVQEERDIDGEFSMWWNAHAPLLVPLGAEHAARAAYRAGGQEDARA